MLSVRNLALASPWEASSPGSPAPRCSCCLLRVASILFLPLLLIMLLGCSATTSTTDGETASEKVQPLVEAHGPLQVLVLDDPKFASLLKSEWLAQSDFDVTVENETESNFLTRLRKAPTELKSDAIVFPSRLLGELAESKFLRNLPPNLTSTSSEAAVEGYDLGDVFRSVSRKEMMWDRRQLGVTLGSPLPMLLVRSDFVPKPPDTWQQLTTVVQELSQKLPDGMQPLAEPVADGWAARMFLSRAASYLYQPSRVSTFFDYTTMKPRIDGEPCVRALEEMAIAYESDRDPLDPAAAYQAILSGRVAMAFTWPRDLGSEEVPTFPLAVRALPGTSEMFDDRAKSWRQLPNSAVTRRIAVLGHEGRMAAISRNGKNHALAGMFLGWAGSKTQSERHGMVSVSSAPFRNSQVASAKAWCGQQLPAQAVRQYAEELRNALSTTDVYLSLRLPGQDRYMQALNEQVLRALHGEVDAKAALEEAAAAWERITDEFGRTKQIQAYRHSLGIDIE